MKKTNDKQVWYCCGGGVFWGLLLLALGLWFLAEDLGYITSNISIWPIILIFLGIWFLLKRNNKYW